MQQQVENSSNSIIFFFFYERNFILVLIMVFNSLIVETGSHYATLTDLELSMSVRPASHRDLLSLTPKLRDERGMLTSPETIIGFFDGFF